MLATYRACAWIDRAILPPCPVEIPVYRMVVTIATALRVRR